MKREHIAHETTYKWQGITHTYAQYTELEWKKVQKRRKANKVAKKQRKLNRKRSSR